MNLPPELYIYILSFLKPKKYENFTYSKNKRCICYTHDSRYKKRCKMKTKNIFCHLHNFNDIKTLLYLENKRQEEELSKRYKFWIN